jgi:hypothetical protein
MPRVLVALSPLPQLSLEFGGGRGGGPPSAASSRTGGVEIEPIAAPGHHRRLSCPASLPSGGGAVAAAEPPPPPLPPLPPSASPAPAQQQQQQQQPRWQPAMARIASGQDLAASAAAVPDGWEPPHQGQLEGQEQQQKPQNQQRHREELRVARSPSPGPPGPPSSTASAPAAPRSDDALLALEHVVRAHRERQKQQQLLQQQQQQQRAASDAAGAVRGGTVAPAAAAAASEPAPGPAGAPASATTVVGGDGGADSDLQQQQKTQPNHHQQQDPDDAERAAMVADGEAPASLGLDTPPPDCARLVREAVTDDHLLQFGALVGELSSRAALAAREGAGGPVGHPASLYGSPDDAAAFAQGWEPIVAEAAPRLLYWGWRRPLRRGLHAYMTRTVFYGTTPAEARAFMLDDAARPGWDDSVAGTAPVAPMVAAAERLARATATGDANERAAAAHALERARRMGGRSESDLLHGRVRLPKPMAPRVYTYARRVWPRPSDGGCYALARACPGAIAERAASAAGAGHRGVAITDFASGCVIRAPPPALVPPGAGPAAEVLMVYFEDAHVAARFANLGIRKALWPLVERTERALRRHQAGAFAAQRATVERAAREAREEEDELERRQAQRKEEEEQQLQQAEAAARLRRVGFAADGGGSSSAAAAAAPSAPSPRLLWALWLLAALSAALAAACAAPAARSGAAPPAAARALLLGGAAQAAALLAAWVLRAAGVLRGGDSGGGRRTLQLPRLEFRFVRWMLRSLAAPRWLRRRPAAAGPRRALGLHRVASHARAAVAAAESLRSHDYTPGGGLGGSGGGGGGCARHPRHGPHSHHDPSDPASRLLPRGAVPQSHALASLDEDDVQAGGGPAPPEWPLPERPAAAQTRAPPPTPAGSTAAGGCPGCFDCRGGAWADATDFYGAARLGACGAAFDLPDYEDEEDDDDEEEVDDDDDFDDLASGSTAPTASASASASRAGRRASARAERRRKLRRRRRMVLRLMQAAGVRLVHRVLAHGSV